MRTIESSVKKVFQLEADRLELETNRVKQDDDNSDRVFNLHLQRNDKDECRLDFVERRFVLETVDCQAQIENLKKHATLFSKLAEKLN